MSSRLHNNSNNSQSNSLNQCPLPPNANNSIVPADYTARLIPDLPKVTLDVVLDVGHWDKGELGSFIDLDDQHIVTFLHADAEFVVSALVGGDKIVKYGDRSDVPSPRELEEKLHCEQKHLLVVQRRKGVVPVPSARALACKMLPISGFAYFLLTVIRPPNEDLRGRTGLGFVAKVVNNKIYVCKIGPNSPASLNFAVGDALLDLNGVQVAFNQNSFVNNYFQQYRDAGKFTTVVERPVTAENLESINDLLGTFFPVPQPENIRMAIDAANIGAEQAKAHAIIFKKVNPKPILRPPPPQNSKENSHYSPVVPRTPKAGRPRTVKTRKENKTLEDTEDPMKEGVKDNGLIKIWPRRIECSIGTDVAEENEKKLRKVDKKVKGRRGRFFNSLFDMF